MTTRPRTVFFRPVLLLLLVPVALSLAPGIASARAPGSVSASATIGGADIAHSSTVHPIHLYPRRATKVRLVVSNRTSSPVTIQSVDISGQVVGLSFFSFDTSVYLSVPARSTARLSFVLDLSSLSGQATGLIPGSLKLSDGNGHVVASQAMVTDVHGSLVSV